MIDPESLYRMWRAEQRRRDVALERRRAHLQAVEPDRVTLPVLAADRTHERAEMKVA